MRRIKEKLDSIQKKNPLWSSYTCFAELVRGRGISQKTITEYFRKLVDKEDYAKKEEKEIIAHLVSI